MYSFPANESSEREDNPYMFVDAELAPDPDRICIRTIALEVDATADPIWALPNNRRTKVGRNLANAR